MDKLILLAVDDVPPILVVLWILWIVGGCLLLFLTRRLIQSTIRSIKGRKYYDNSSKIVQKYGDVMDRKYEKYGIGGTNALDQTGVPKETLTVLFDAVEDEAALVNLALEGKVSIENVILDTLNPLPQEQAVPRHVVSVDIQNKTDEPISLNVPKGQVFENKDAKSRTQNLAIASDYRGITLDKGTKVRIKLDAHCVNKRKAPPKEVLGNISIFALRDCSFVSQEQLWQIVEEAKDEILAK